MLQTSNMAVNLLTVFWEYLDMTTCYLDITVHYLDLTEGPDTRCNIVCNCVRRGGDNCCKLCKQGNLIGYMQAFCCVTPLHAMLQEAVQYAHSCTQCNIVVWNVAEVILQATIAKVDTRCNSALACNIACNVASIVCPILKGSWIIISLSSGLSPFHFPVRRSIVRPKAREPVAGTIHYTVPPAYHVLSTSEITCGKFVTKTLSVCFLVFKRVLQIWCSFCSEKEEFCL